MEESAQTHQLQAPPTRRRRDRLVSGHVLVPALTSAAIVALYFTPVSIISCATRGLLAFGVAVTALLAGVVTAAQAVRFARRDRERAGWWILSTIVFMLPAMLLLGPLG